MTNQLLSVGTLLQEGYVLQGDSSHISVQKRSQQHVIDFHPHLHEPTIYWLSAEIVTNPAALQALNMSAFNSYDLWHKRLGHPSPDVFRQFDKSTVGIPNGIRIPTDLPICKACQEGKMVSGSFLDSMSRAMEPFGLIHSDLKSLPVISYHKYKYIITFLDDYTSFGWTMFLKLKDEAYKAIDYFIAVVKTQYKKRIVSFMTNAGGEYKSLRLQEKFKEHGIHVQQSVPHMPQQNRHAERFNRTFMEKEEALCYQACLPKSWWEFAVEYTIHMYNCTPLKCLSKTPYEMLNGVKPDISHLRILGCAAYIFLHEDQRDDALSPRAELMMFIGYTDGIKGWKFMCSNGTIFLATKAVFNKNAFPCCPEWNHANILAIELGILPYDETIPQEDYDYRGPDDHYPPGNDADDVWQSIRNVFPPFSRGGNQPPQNPQQPNPQGSQPNVGSGNQPSQAPGPIVAGPPPILGPGPMMVDPQANQPPGPTAAPGPVVN